MKTPRPHRNRPRPAAKTGPKSPVKARPFCEPLEDRALLATLIVSTTTDTSDTTGNNLSLRLAIEVADGTIPVSSLSATMQSEVIGSILTTSPNHIVFALPNTSGVNTISVTSALPAITNALTIEGYSQQGSAVDPTLNVEVAVNKATVQIDGSGVSAAGTDGLDVEAPNCAIDGLIITGFTGSGISISGAGSQGNSVDGCFIGTLPDTTRGHDFDSPLNGNKTAGIRITSSNNRIGDDSPDNRNVIANNGDGIEIDTTTGTGDLVRDNFILYNTANGIKITSSNNTIGDLSGAGGNVISGNGGAGVLIEGTDGVDVQGNILQEDEIGTDVGVLNTSVDRGEVALENGDAGVSIIDSANNTVGGTATAARNVIAGNALDGVAISGLTSTGNRVQTNYIGFNETNGADFVLPNRNGVSITGSPGNFIGGSSGNSIGENRFNGILLTDTPAGTPNTIAGNIIGLNPGGGVALSNAQNGIDLENSADTVIGGTTTSARNTISSNNNGIVLDGSGSTGDLIEGNFIGTGSDGIEDLGNAVNGILLNNAPTNTIGGTTAGAANVISGNNVGVRIIGAQATGNVVEGNFIGTDLTGQEFVGNEVDGIAIASGASNTTVGGTATGAGNTIEFNTGFGVNVDSGTANAIRANSIFNNVAGGIRLNSVNSANNNQVAPVLTVATPNGPGVNVQGTLTASPLKTYTLDFFATPTQTSPGVTQGETYLGSMNVTTSAAGTVTFAANLATAVPSGEFVTSTATDPLGNTSTFSADIPAQTESLQFAVASATVNETDGAATITVTRTGGTGGAVAVTYATSNGTATAGVDYTTVTNTLFFSPGDASKTFTVPILNPGKVGGTTAFDITLTNPTNGATLGTPKTLVVTINENDGPSLTLTPTSPSVAQSSGNLTFTVTRNVPTGTSTVHYATVNGTAVAGTNFQAVSGTLTFAPGVTTQTITVPLIDDHLIHGSLGFVVALSSPTGAALNPPTSSNVTLLDTDNAGAIGLTNPSLVTSPGATSYAVVVQRLGGSAGTSTVHYATTSGSAVAGTDFTPVSGTLTFAPGVTSQVVNVPLLNTANPGPTRFFNFLLSSPTGGATLGYPAASFVTIVHGAAVVGPVNTVAPVVTAVNLISNSAGVDAVQFTFDEAMDPTRAVNPASYGYFFLGAGGDKTFGTGDDFADTIKQVLYDPSTLTATVIPATPLPANFVERVTLNAPTLVAQGVGLTNTSGTYLAGNTGGTSYVATFEAGDRVSYNDAAGNAVALTLSGAGSLALRFAPSGNPQSVGIVGPVGRNATLTGTVRPVSRRVKAATPLPTITGTAGVKVRLNRPPFYQGVISAQAVDALAMSGRLAARRHR